MNYRNLMFSGNMLEIRKCPSRRNVGNRTSPGIPLALLLITFAGCAQANEQDYEGHLLASSSRFVMDDGNHADGYYSNRDSFIAPYRSADYHGDTLVATTLYEVNTCATTVGSVRLSHDTLYLLIDRKDKGGCGSVEFRLFRYVVRVPEGEKYHVVF